MQFLYNFLGTKSKIMWVNQTETEQLVQLLCSFLVESRQIFSCLIVLYVHPKKRMYSMQHCVMYIWVVLCFFWFIVQAGGYFLSISSLSSFDGLIIAFIILSTSSQRFECWSVNFFNVFIRALDSSLIPSVVLGVFVLFGMLTTLLGVVGISLLFRYLISVVWCRFMDWFATYVFRSFNTSLAQP